jgi:hypothetical protein
MTRDIGNECIAACVAESWGDAPSDEERWQTYEMVCFVEPIATRVLGLKGEPGARRHITLRLA